MIGKITISASVALVSMLFYTGCGSSSSSSSTDTPAVVTPTGSAFYVDSAVEGVQMNCGGVETTTDLLGSFAIVEGASCSFKLNDLLLREQAGVKDGDIILEEDIQVAQFLQSLDNDNDPSNGITITSEVLAQLQKDGVVTVPATDEALAEIIASLQNASIGFGGDFVTEAVAQAHLDATKKALEGGDTANEPSEGGDTTNKPPRAVAPANFTIEENSVVELDGSKSSDEDGEIASYVWVELGNEGNPREGVIGEFSGLSIGEHRFKLTVTDNHGASSSAEVTVTVKSSEIAANLIETAFVGKNLYKPVTSGSSALVVKNLFSRKTRDVTPSPTPAPTATPSPTPSPAVHRPVIEEYAYSDDGTTLTFTVRYTDDGSAMLTEEYSYTIEDGYLNMTVVTSSGADSFPVGTIIKLHMIELTDEYVVVKEELIGAVDDIPAGAVKMYYSAEDAAALSQ